MILTLNNNEDNILRKLGISDFRVNEIVNATNNLINEKKKCKVQVDYAELVNELQFILLTKSTSGGLNNNELHFISFLLGNFSYDTHSNVEHFVYCDNPFLCYCITIGLVNLNAQCCN